MTFAAAAATDGLTICNEGDEGDEFCCWWLVGGLVEVNIDFMVLAGVLGLRLFWCEFALDDDDDADGVADDLSGTDGGLDDDNGFNRFDEDNLLGRRVRMARNNSSLSSGGASAMICCKASTRCNTNCIRKF